MHIERIYSGKDKKHCTTLLRETYREDGKVKKRTLQNLDSWSSEKIANFEALLKNQKIISNSNKQAIKAPKIENGKSYGALYVFKKIADSLFITDVLGHSKKGRLALLMACLRPIKAVSKLATVSLAQNQACEEILGIHKFDENSLYGSLEWLNDNQDRIENELYNLRAQKCSTFYLYDVTSSYVEGRCNALAEFGYNRDKKSGKRQIVIGMLKDEFGLPVSVQVYEGNKLDQKTFNDQIEKLKRFGVKNVVMVGDRGMIKQAQIDELNKEHWKYVTAITKAQIESMLDNKIVQLSWFDETLTEFEHAEKRYILRRNPVRAEEMSENRNDRIAKFKTLFEQKVAKLEISKRLKPKTIYQQICVLLSKYKLETFINIRFEDDKIEFDIDKEKLESMRNLDGCYVITTNLTKEECEMDRVHEIYKDLAMVESGFKLLKSTLDIRPLWHQKEKTTRGHVFIAMLALMLTEEFERSIKGLNISVKAAIESLNNIQMVTFDFMNDKLVGLPTKLRDDQKQLLAALNIELPRTLSNSKISKT